mmetsp:Transcript_421/g.522  ORF Transcript_421/g.522 Transcript_421/m.522 type:complete len:96 (+) Transcript_421:1575-1862(+)
MVTHKTTHSNSSTDSSSRSMGSNSTGSNNTDNSSMVGSSSNNNRGVMGILREERNGATAKITQLKKSSICEDGRLFKDVITQRLGNPVHQLIFVD